MIDIFRTTNYGEFIKGCLSNR